MGHSVEKMATHIVSLNRDSFHKRDEILTWCTEHFGSIMTYGYGYAERWSMSDAFGHQHYKFSNLEDASFFALKWK